MRRRSLIIANLFVLLLAAADFAYWRITAERLRTGLNDWLAAQTARGWTTAADTASLAGWPFAATVSVPNLTLRHAGPDGPGTIKLAFSGITLLVPLYNPVSLTIAMKGPAHVQIAGWPDLLLSGRQIEATMPLQPQPQPLRLRVNDFRLEPASGLWQATMGLFSAQLETDKGVDRGNGQAGPSAAFILGAEAIALPSVMKWPLGPNISSVFLDGVLNGPMPRAQNPMAWATAWRDAGGSMKITHLTLGWGPLGVTCSANLKLDDRLQLAGTGQSRITGYAQTVDQLAAAGVLTAPGAAAAKAILTLMSGNADTEGPSAINVPLTLQYRTLSMHQVPLLRLPELDWPTR